MPIFGTKQMEELQQQALQLQKTVAQLTLQLEQSRQQNEQLRVQLDEITPKLERADKVETALAATKAKNQELMSILKQLESSLNASIGSLGSMLQVAPGRWVDPTAIWHVFLQRPTQTHELQPLSNCTLFLNSQEIDQGPESEMKMVVERIMKAKAQKQDRGES